MCATSISAAQCRSPSICRPEEWREERAVDHPSQASLRWAASACPVDPGEMTRRPPATVNTWAGLDSRHRGAWHDLVRERGWRRSHRDWPAGHAYELDGRYVTDEQTGARLRELVARTGVSPERLLALLAGHAQTERARVALTRSTHNTPAVSPASPNVPPASRPPTSGRSR
ncbi:malate:quinone oxidoreductase [Streptomyces sp. KO7888]|nr:malate:quinone oxidoreductase [Streptomyces sp. KO7888]